MTFFSFWRGASMDRKNYFENTEGIGVLASADAEGRVDAAIYSRPHVMDSDTVAFICSQHGLFEAPLGKGINPTHVSFNVELAPKSCCIHVPDFPKDRPFFPCPVVFAKAPSHASETIGISAI